MKRLITSGGFLLGGSAIISKLLGFWRDRLFIEKFSAENVDLIFAAFRIPDFFFYLFVGATISVVFIPRLVDLKKEEEEVQFVSSFFWGVAVFFGVLSLAGVVSTNWLVKIFAAGFTPDLQSEIANLARYLFGSVFLLSISGVFSAFLQARHKFISLALAPLFYVGTICGGLFLFGKKDGLNLVGILAISGAFLHFLFNFVGFFLNGGELGFFWKKPLYAFKNFKADFWRRVVNNSAFQINQTADVVIASFLMVGSVTAFSIGTSLGHVLLSIVGFSVANSAVPKLSHAKGDKETQKKILKNSLKWILFFTVPATIIGAVGAEFFLKLFYNMEEKQLKLTQTVFFWTVLSMPAACMAPTLSRAFLANDDTTTPLRITMFNLTFATCLAATLSLVILPKDKAILGLALGNFTVNYLNAILFWVFLRREFFAKTKKLSQKEKELLQAGLESGIIEPKTTEELIAMSKKKYNR